MYLSKAKKPTFLGAINGMVVGLVAITPSAGYVNGAGALAIGAIDSTIVWLAWNYLSRVNFMKKVDDAMGIVYTHGIAGLFGGLLLGVFADPTVVVYQSVGGNKVDITGALYGHPGQIGLQLGAALTVIIWDGLVTFVILTVMKAVMPSHSLRYSDDILEIGDLAVHDEEGYPDDRGVTRILPGYGEAAVHAAAAATASGGGA
jgi:Amt family ammonium transporter